MIWVVKLWLQLLGIVVSLCISRFPKSVPINISTNFIFAPMLIFMHSLHWICDIAETVVLPHDMYIYILYVIIVITISNSLRSVPDDNLLRSYCKFELISWSLFNCWINAFCISHIIFIWSFVFCFYLIVILWSACDWRNLFSQFLQLHVAVT